MVLEDQGLGRMEDGRVEGRRGTREDGQEKKHSIRQVPSDNEAQSALSKYTLRILTICRLLVRRIVYHYTRGSPNVLFHRSLVSSLSA